MRCLAIDMGSSSIRGIVGDWNEDACTLTRSEVYRHRHAVVEKDGFLQWDLASLRKAAREAVEAAGPVDSIAIDGWGVDYVIVDDSNTPLGSAIAYRDPAGSQGRNLLKTRLSETRQYEITGVLPQDINTVYRLAANPPKAGTLMFLVDYLARELTSSPSAIEPWASKSVASTSGLVNRTHTDWAPEMLRASGLEESRLPKLANELQTIGRTIAGAAIIAAGSHDTACAIYCLTPEFGNHPDTMFLSCGSWAVAGTTSTTTYVDQAAYRAGITNEADIQGQSRAQLNLTGLWIEQECRRAWGNPSYDQLSVTPDTATKALQWEREPAKLIDVCDPQFNAPGSMPTKVVKAADARGVTLRHREEILRYVLDSLAYAQTNAIRQLRLITGRHGPLTVIGGGTQNKYLMERTALELGETIRVGDPESSALGNLLAQLITLGVDSDRIREWMTETSLYREITP